MGRLFWKIFIGFWLAMAIIAIGSSVLTARLAEQRLSKFATLPDDETLDRWAGELRQILSSPTPGAVHRWLRSHRGHGRSLWLLDPDGHDLRHRRVPPFMLSDAGASPSIFNWLHPTPPNRQRSLPTQRGATYRLIVTPGPPRAMGRRMADAHNGPFRRWFWSRHLVVLLVGGVFCLLLARYLSAPLRHLRAATQGLAAGDMSARVGARLGRRKDEIGDLARDFDAMAENLARLLESRQHLLWDLSHELRSPLARMQVALELARTRPAQQSRKALDRIQRETERLDGLIEQSLAWARLDRKPGAKRQALNLTALVAEIAADAAYEAHQNRVEVSINMEDSIPIDADSALLGRAISNVLRNAMRHAPRGSRVSVTSEFDSAAVHIRVRDQGSGVKGSDLQRIFEPFVRLDESRAHAQRGSGLGLAIARAAIEAHGGTISASNHPDGGLEILINLPRG